ncbi:MAG TPA: zf-HC2 domain-containing protein, partial [Blastocatellia bacterium]|nr:zf-HC2 domain-containing protein [Blastocatellia bacterium]
MNTDRAKECRAVEDLLVALAAGELESEHAAQLRAHLEDCARCSSAFAEVSRAETLAASLKLESPQIDRYTEFLRRLAAGESQSLTVNSEQPLDPANDAKAGVAAVIPLFGNRVAVRNGFGRGFDLSVTSRQGREWLHLSAKSLTRVAAVAGGVSLAAGISVVALLWMLFTFGKSPSTEPQNPPPVERPPMRAADDAPWIQTASTAERTLAIWREGTELQAGWMSRGQSVLSDRFQLRAPVNTPVKGNRPPLPPRAMECAVATDGKDFIVLREIEGGIYLWRIESQTVAPPILLSRKGAQPRAAWIGDRYVVVWVAPDMLSPVIEMLEVGRDGRPLQTSATLVAQTAQGGKVGLPGVTGGNGKVLVTYFVQGGAL